MIAATRWRRLVLAVVALADVVVTLVVAVGSPDILIVVVPLLLALTVRAAFVPESLRRWSDRDAPLPIGEGQTISQPFVVALMTQATGFPAPAPAQL